jgi:hypothetical protein
MKEIEQGAHAPLEPKRDNGGGTPLEELFGPVISRYTRAQGIEDGVLIDVSETAREAGIVFPVAVTRAVWEDCCEWTEADGKAKCAGQSVRGRLWDVVSMLRFAIKVGRGGELIHYRLSRIPRPGHGAKRLVTLKSVCGPGDDGAPVITIMLPVED